MLRLRPPRKPLQALFDSDFRRPSEQPARGFDVRARVTDVADTEFARDAIGILRTAQRPHQRLCHFENGDGLTQANVDDRAVRQCGGATMRGIVV